MPTYGRISQSEFNARYNKLANYLAEDRNANKPLPQIINELEPLFSTNGETLSTDIDLNRKLLILNREDNYKSLYHIAAAENNLRVIIFLKGMQHDINIADALHRTALYIASSELKLKSVHTLLMLDANPNKGNTQLVVGIRGDRVPLNGVINSRYIDPARTTVTQANEQTAAAIVKKLIEAGADVNLQTGDENFSALHRAIINRKPLILQEIINSKKANYDLVSFDGETVLHMLVDYRSQDEKEKELDEMRKEKQMLDMLTPKLTPHIESLDAQDINGDTSLHKAVINSNVDVVKALYKKDHLFSGDEKLLSIQNNRGNTPIHEAIEEAKRGPKVLELLLRVATEADLSKIKNNAGETAKEMAARLYNQAKSIQSLTEAIRIATQNLDDTLKESEIDEIDVLRDINQLKETIIKLNDHELNSYETLHSKASKALSLSIEGLLIDIDVINSFSNADAPDLITRSRKLVAETKKEFFEDSYLNSLQSVQQTDYLEWKKEKLQLPSSFSNLEVVDPNFLNAHREEYFIAGELAYKDGLIYYHRKDYDEAIRRLRVSSVAFRTKYPQHSALGKTYFQLGKAYAEKNNNVNARANFEKSIEIYTHIKEYHDLEGAYQALAETYINEDQAAVIHYENQNQNKLLNGNSETVKLQGHLALAGLYKKIKEHPGSFPLSEEDLSAYESFHYKESYKFTQAQGNLDNEAHVVLQSEFGIAQAEKLGTYNIKQCVAVIVHDPITQKVVLSHFDKYSGPLSFIDQIRKEFSSESQLDLYLNGGRDREGGKGISDNNIDQVLKQIYTYKERFTIKASDLGDKPSPEAIVFDVKSKALKQAMPNHPDSSFNSRLVNLLLVQARKDEYLLPPNVVDFTKTEAERQIIFTQAQQKEIKDEYRDFDEVPDQTQGWNHDSKFSIFMEAHKDRAQTFNFNQKLLGSVLNNLNVAHPVNPPVDNDVEMEDLGVQINDDDLDGMDIDDLVGRGDLNCAISRRKRSTEACLIEGKSVLELLQKISETQQSKILEQLQTRNIGGTNQNEVSILLQNHRVTQHLEKAGKFSSGLIDAMFSENALAGLFNGDPTAAIQLAGLNLVNRVLVGASDLLEKKRMLALATGAKGLAFGYGARVVSKGASLLAVWDAINQIKVLQKSGNNTDAMVAIASDGIQIGTDLLRGGIEIAEVTSERFAALGFSAVAGPAGEAVVAVVMLGDRIYEKVEEIDKENHQVHLSGWEKFKEGSRAFLAFGPEQYISTMIKKVEEYGRILSEQQKLFESSTNIKHIIIPGIEKIGETCRMVEEPVLFGCSGGLLFPAKKENCVIWKQVCDPVFHNFPDSSVDLRYKSIGFEISRLQIVSPAGTELLCKPTENDGYGDELPEQGAYACDAAIGFTHINSTGNAALFMLGEGEDHVAGFEDIPNFFMVNNGAKDYEGGKQDDSFIIQATQVWSVLPTDREGIGGLNGAEGSDSLILSGFQPATDRIEIDLNAGHLQAGNNTLTFTSIEKFVGGVFPFSVTAGCTTEEIDTEGGPTAINPDIILIPKNENCSYVLQVHLKPNVILTNEATQGNFTYYVLPGKGIVSVNLTAIENSPSIQQQFIFNASISDVFSKIFSDKSADDEQQQTMKLHFTDGLEFQLNANLPSFHFLADKANAKFKIGKQNSYVFITTTLSIEKIMKIYPPTARQLNMIFIINTLRNETVVIGHQGQEVMQNNPRAQRTHLHGNGGEGLFVMDATSAESFQSQLPLNQVVIYNDKNNTHINTLDFRKLYTQIEKLNATAEIFFTTPNRRNKLGNDLVLQLAMNPKNSLRRIPVISVCLKDGFINQWYKKYLHIILAIAPKKIIGPLSSLGLKSIPLKFNEKSEILYIGANDIEADTEIIIPREYQEGHFFDHNHTNLIWTNTLNKNYAVSLAQPLTIIFANFNKEPKLASLSIKFSNKTIRLKNRLTQINTAADFEEVKNTQNEKLKKQSQRIIKQVNTLTDNQKVTDSSLSQHHYFSNDINATSIEEAEYNENQPGRRRREIESAPMPIVSSAAPRSSGVIQSVVRTFKNSMTQLFSNNAKKNKADRTYEMADKYYEKHQTFKGGALHTKKKTIKLAHGDSVKQANDKVKQAIPVSKQQVPNAVPPKIFKKENGLKPRKNSSTGTGNNAFLFKQVQRQTYISQNTRKYKQTSYVNLNHDQVKVDQSGLGRLGKLQNQTRKYLYAQQVEKASLPDHQHRQHNNGYQQHARQQTGKSSIKQVTASSSMNATLLLINVMSGYKVKPPLNTKITRLSEKLDRQTQKILGRPRGLRI